jgi:hypothetical protein
MHQLDLGAAVSCGRPGGRWTSAGRCRRGPGAAAPVSPSRSCSINGTLQLFRGAKLRLIDVPPDLITDAMRPGRRLVRRADLDDRPPTREPVFAAIVGGGLVTPRRTVRPRRQMPDVPPRRPSPDRCRRSCPRWLISAGHGSRIGALGLLRDDEERQAGLTAGCSGLVIKGTLVIHPATIHRKDSPSRDDLAGSGHARVLAWAPLQYQIFTSSAGGTIGPPRRAANSFRS